VNLSDTGDSEAVVRGTSCAGAHTGGDFKQAAMCCSLKEPASPLPVLLPRPSARKRTAALPPTKQAMSKSLPLNTAAGVSSCTLAVLTVLCGCASQAPKEIVNPRDKGCAHLVYFTENLFTMAASSGALRSPRRLPWRLHMSLAALDAGYVMLLSVALSTSLPTAAVMTFKNGNLVVSVLLDTWALSRSHSWMQLAAVTCITSGLAVTSLCSSPARAGGSGEVDCSALIGLACVLGALVSRASASVVQELYCVKYNAPAVELLLFRSALGLPLLATRWRAIVRHAVRWSTESQIAGLPGLAFWVLQCLNVAFDFGTKFFITRLMSRTSALTATMVLTIQRFISFVLSATFLGAEPVGWKLCLGTMAVLAGSICYAASPMPSHDHTAAASSMACSHKKKVN